MGCGGSTPEETPVPDDNVSPEQVTTVMGAPMVGQPHVMNPQQGMMAHHHPQQGMHAHHQPQPGMMPGMMAQPNVLNIQVPMNVGPGMLFTFRMPDGTLANAQCPPGAGPGAIIPVQAPPRMQAAPPQPQMILVDVNGDGIPDEWRPMHGGVAPMQMQPTQIVVNQIQPPPPRGEPQGFQTDGAGPMWCAVAKTRWGKIPGKAPMGGNKCWFSYGGEEHTTHDFLVCQQHRQAPPGSETTGRLLPSKS